jgi:hypothetical protein
MDITTYIHVYILMVSMVLCFLISWWNAALRPPQWFHHNPLGPFVGGPLIWNPPTQNLLRNIKKHYILTRKHTESPHSFGTPWSCAASLNSASLSAGSIDRPDSTEAPCRGVDTPVPPLQATRTGPSDFAQLRLRKSHMKFISNPQIKSMEDDFLCCHSVIAYESCGVSSCSWATRRKTRSCSPYSSIFRTLG